MKAGIVINTLRCLNLLGLTFISFMSLGRLMRTTKEERCRSGTRKQTVQLGFVTVQDPKISITS